MASPISKYAVPRMIWIVFLLIILLSKLSELSKKLKEHTLELDRQYEFLITLTDNFDQITHKYEKEISQLEDSRS